MRVNTSCLVPRSTLKNILCRLTVTLLQTTEKESHHHSVKLETWGKTILKSTSSWNLTFKYTLHSSSSFPFLRQTANSNRRFGLPFSHSLSVSSLSLSWLIGCLLYSHSSSKPHLEPTHWPQPIRKQFWGSSEITSEFLEGILGGVSFILIVLTNSCSFTASLTQSETSERSAFSNFKEHIILLVKHPLGWCTFTVEGKAFQEHVNNHLRLAVGHESQNCQMCLRCVAVHSLWPRKHITDRWSFMWSANVVLSMPTTSVSSKKGQFICYQDI